MLDGDLTTGIGDGEIDGQFLGGGFYDPYWSPGYAWGWGAYDPYFYGYTPYRYNPYRYNPYRYNPYRNSRFGRRTAYNH